MEKATIKYSVYLISYKGFQGTSAVFSRAFLYQRADAVSKQPVYSHRTFRAGSMGYIFFEYLNNSKYNPDQKVTLMLIFSNQQSYLQQWYSDQGYFYHDIQTSQYSLCCKKRNNKQELTRTLGRNSEKSNIIFLPRYFCNLHIKYIFS